MGLTVSAVNGDTTEVRWQDEEERSHLTYNVIVAKHRCIEQFVSGTGLCDDYNVGVG